VSCHQKKPRKLAALKQGHVVFFLNRRDGNNLTEIFYHVRMPARICRTGIYAGSEQSSKYLNKTEFTAQMFPPIQPDSYCYVDDYTIAPKLTGPLMVGRNGQSGSGFIPDIS